ncbi:hypothetical protein GLOTRDRAFT_120972 [Gloeophyllum trabeum ATCC 11539]|uniref:Uncharacterized protein n=1 Tax=Gloeophyllum trabeum (strain ATCC 11539 / FP-39264 / Madison 617) TaxID=670483 RepID=S7QB10_GLOTA|nr:uncharacterized protein GLOTRDRAFT_120972 [Gloeophyllum trabeum ATCC 11539]EPQ56518.1 hypothetical protein GLOTRDRAFT_120972 [Gloeophyllum trabeum ATCC 11539]
MSPHVRCRVSRWFDKESRLLFYALTGHDRAAQVSSSLEGCTDNNIERTGTEWERVPKSACGGGFDCSCSPSPLLHTRTTALASSHRSCSNYRLHERGEPGDVGGVLALCDDFARCVRYGWGWGRSFKVGRKRAVRRKERREDVPVGEQREQRRVQVERRVLIHRSTVVVSRRYQYDIAASESPTRVSTYRAEMLGFPEDASWWNCPGGKGVLSGGRGGQREGVLEAPVGVPAAAKLALVDVCEEFRAVGGAEGARGGQGEAGG